MIEWDGKETAESYVIITDMSERNGTWVSTGIALYFPSKHSPTFPTIALRVAAQFSKDWARTVSRLARLQHRHVRSSQDLHRQERAQG